MDVGVDQKSDLKIHLEPHKGAQKGGRWGGSKIGLVCATLCCCVLCGSMGWCMLLSQFASVCYCVLLRATVYYGVLVCDNA